MIPRKRMSCLTEHAHLPKVDLPLTQRNAQLVIAEGYGCAGWQDLTAEVRKRLVTACSQSS
jgi:hypothetical protein